MSVPDRIYALTLAEIERVTTRYGLAKDWTAWRDGMRKAIAAGHAAAVWAGAGERLVDDTRLPKEGAQMRGKRGRKKDEEEEEGAPFFVPIIIPPGDEDKPEEEQASNWIAGVYGERELPEADQQLLTQTVQSELGYFNRFLIEAGAISAAMLAARAALYAGAVRRTYYIARWGDWIIPPELLPGNQVCMGNCKCRITGIRDNGDGSGILNRVMGSEPHCTECPPLQGDHTVYRRLEWVSVST